MNDIESSAEVKKLKIVKFTKGLYIKEPVDLVLGVSMGNEKQEGENLMAFVESCNANHKNIKSVEFMVTGHLHRHYVGVDAARDMHHDWVRQNKEILQHLTIPYKITDWKDVIETAEFQRAQLKIAELYEKDTSFHIKVENVARSHISKADMPTVTKYLLEECAYFFCKSVNFAYPADKLNSACMHIIQKYNTDFTFRGYNLLQPKHSQHQTLSPLLSVPIHAQNGVTSTAQTQAQTQRLIQQRNSPPRFCELSTSSDEEITPQFVLAACGQISYLMDKIGLHGSHKKEAFFSRYVKNEDACLQLLDTGLTPTIGTDDASKLNNTSSFY